MPAVLESCTSPRARWGSRALLALLLVLALPAVAAARGDVIELENGDLTNGTVGWNVTTPSWSLDVETLPDHVTRMLRFRGSSDTGIFLRALPVQAYRGHLLRLSARVRVARGMRGQIWARVDRDDGEPGFFDNMSDRSVRDAEWTDVEIHVAVDGHALQLVFGGLCSGAGGADFEAFVLEDLGPLDELETGRPIRLSAGASARLAATAELLGVLRWFYPDPMLEALDWDAFTVHAVDRVRAVSSDPALADALRELLAPVAPRVLVFPTGDAPPRAPPPSAADHELVYVWSHQGFGPATSGVYRSELHGMPLHAFAAGRAESDGEFADLAALGDVWEGEIGAGLSARVPLNLVFTREELAEAGVWRPDGPGLHARLRVCERSTRLASVITLWSAMRQFYPYFDAVDVDWRAQLEPALRAAAVAPGINAQLRILQELAAHLHDGHAYVAHARKAALGRLPFEWAWLDEGLVITAVSPGATDVEVGDLVERVDGTPAATLIEQHEARESASTPGHRRRRALAAALWGPRDSSIELRVRHGTRTKTLDVRYDGDAPVEPRPEPVADLGDGVLYADLTRLDSAAWQAALPRLAGAAGLVLDMRGYPRALGAEELFGPLISEAVASPQWHIPLYTRPGNAPLRYVSSNWTLTPSEPHLAAPKVFLVDERAVSYTESGLGIVEAYELGALLGRPSAGTNGNVSSLALPGGFTLGFTGMRVLKHDGSPHHGVGIHPTHPVQRTRAGVAAGRDEQLEAAKALLLEAR